MLGPDKQLSERRRGEVDRGRSRVERRTETIERLRTRAMSAAMQLRTCSLVAVLPGYGRCAAVSASDLFNLIHRDSPVRVRQSCLGTLCMQNPNTSGFSPYVRSKVCYAARGCTSSSLQFVRRWGTSMGLWGAGTGILALYVSISSP